MKVRPVEAADEHSRRRPGPARRRMSSARARIGGRGQRHPRHAGEALRQQRRGRGIPAGTRGPTAMTQCASSMANSAMPASRQPRQRAVASSRSGETYSSSRRRSPGRGATSRASSSGQFGMQRGGGDAQLAQRRDLVLHQRDQRRDDHRGARPAQRRHLVAERSCRRRSASAPGRRRPPSRARRSPPAGRGSRDSRRRDAAPLRAFPRRPGSSATDMAPASGRGLPPMPSPHIPAAPCDAADAARSAADAMGLAAARQGRPTISRRPDLHPPAFRRHHLEGHRAAQLDPDARSAPPRRRRGGPPPAGPVPRPG